MPQKKLCLVTGVAGFIGSHLARRLLHDGYRVIGIDCFTDYYDVKIKEANIADLTGNPDFELDRRDVVKLDPRRLEGVDYVFHQAAQAGVRASWGREFVYYTHHNILATQRILEWARQGKPKRIVCASSSSVYGEVEKLPMHEDDRPRPLSPYGVSKLAAEHLCDLYYRNFDVPVVSLRYFTVYGPGQRPDMAFHRFMTALQKGGTIEIYGTGEQTRDFTYIDDIVEANLAAARTGGVEGRVYNIGGGSRVSVNEVLKIIGRLSGRNTGVVRLPGQAGDPGHTYADTSRARDELGFSPQTPLAVGLKAMVDSFAWDEERPVESEPAVQRPEREFGFTEEF